SHIGPANVSSFGCIADWALALVAALVLTYQFVRREMGHAFYALLAMILFGVTAVYQQAVFWFSASFSIMALDMILFGLFPVQAYRQTGFRAFLLLSAVWCGLAPCWFAIGVLAGPICATYLIFSESHDPRVAHEVSDETTGCLLRARLLGLCFAVVPMIGTAT